MKRKGFTIIELAVVLGIIAILAVVSTVAVGNIIDGLRLSNAAEKLAADLRYAQSMAHTTATWVGVSFEVDPLNQYTIYTTDGTTDVTVENPARLGSNFVVNVNTDFGVTMIVASMVGSNKVEFSPLGTPYIDKDGLLMVQEGLIILSRGSANREVRITTNTGRIFIQ
jgi:prepilin-type N-terminal cleavage/methylation domain-containing protein